jgi:hypothetical protein
MVTLIELEHKYFFLLAVSSVERWVNSGQRDDRVVG